MTKIAQQLTDLIGHTPLLALNRYSAAQGLESPLIAKIEYFNPGGSVKDRVALAMIEDAEAKGIIQPGATIIEPTSGNTGVGLALVSAVKGYHLILTMPETMSIERRNLVKAYGAEVVLTSGKDGMPGAIKEAERLRDTIPGSVILQQFKNPANPQKHYLTTGPEIWSDTEGKVDIIVAGVGTGGTLSGIAKYLKEQNPSIKAYAVEPASSPVLNGGNSGPLFRVTSEGDEGESFEAASASGVRNPPPTSTGPPNALMMRAITSACFGVPANAPSRSTTCSSLPPWSAQSFACAAGSSP